MDHPDLAVVTGAFGYTDGYVARRLIVLRLLDRGNGTMSGKGE